jgi:hypothetical protein
MTNTSTPTTYVLTNVSDVDNVLINENKRLNAKKELIDKAEFSQNRVQDLNESYRKRYIYYNYIAVVVVIVLLIYLGLVILQYFFPIIPTLLVDLVTIFVFAFIIIFVFYHLIIIYSRDRLNFDKINMENANIISKEELNKQRQKDIASGNLSAVAGIDIGNNCIGAACCSNGTQWDAGNLVCMGNGISGFTTINDSFSGFENSDIIINGSIVTPFKPSEFDNYAKI